MHSHRSTSPSQQQAEWSTCLASTSSITPSSTIFSNDINDRYGSIPILPLPTIHPSTSSGPYPVLQSRYHYSNPTTSSSSSLYQPYPRGVMRSNSSRSLNSYDGSLPIHTSRMLNKPRLTTTLWEDESTLCYQIDSRGICVTRRQDNDMINGTKLLNVAGITRGKRDGILKNEKGRIVVKIGAMHLKGVWIPFDKAKILANQFKIMEILYPLFSDDPNSFLYPAQLTKSILPSYRNTLAHGLYSNATEHNTANDGIWRDA